MDQFSFSDLSRLPQAVILSAPDPEESFRAARQIAQALVCGSDGPRPCGHCPACRKALQDIHPDILTVRREKDSQGRLRRELLVDQIRFLVRDAVVLPNESARKVYILREADRMNLQAQNAALKLLEEPPRGVYFLLCVSNPELLLETVRSRCAEYALRPAAAAETEARALAAAYLRAVAARDRMALLLWCRKNEGLDLRSAPDFFEALRELIADLLAGRESEPRLPSEELLRLEALCARCLRCLQVNVGVKQVFGLLAVDSIAEEGKQRIEH